MKCPKCGYLGFETSDRCRNCGYDFSLSTTTDAAELPLQSADGPGVALADLTLSDTHVGAEDTVRAAEATTPPKSRVTPASHRGEGGALPLFARQEPGDGPAITPPPARPPLAVRRTTPEIPRGRSRSATPPRQSQADDLLASSDAIPEDRPAPAVDIIRPSGLELRAAGRTARLMATLMDGLLLAVIDAAVIYLTLALAGLQAAEIGRLPLLPLAGFFLILNGGYLIAFVAASGQTIGKMAAGIRVIGDDGQRVDIGGAVLRATGCVLSLLTAGLGYLPAFVSADGRALQDRMSGTRVVSAR